MEFRKGGPGEHYDDDARYGINSYQPPRPVPAQCEESNNNEGGCHPKGRQKPLMVQRWSLQQADQKGGQDRRNAQ
jgi:hypothetical protein